MELNENDIKFILQEAKLLLTEDQESDSIKKAIALYMNRMGCRKQEAEKFVRIDLRQDLPNLRSKKGGKFIFGVTRMFLDRQLTNGDIIEQLNTTIKYVADETHYNEYDKNLNGLSAQELIKRFSDSVKKDAAADKERLSQNTYNKNNNYQIVSIDTFEESSNYRQYTTWCITRSEHMLNSYTNDGVGQFYFCLKNGFEDLPPIQGEGCPLDEYGLSMIAVCVDGQGRLKTCTCRWNHDNNGNDNIMNTEQISNVIGMNFYDVFKPNNKWEKAITELKAKLVEGMPLGYLFKEYKKFGDSGLYKVYFKGRYNLVNENTREFVSDTWFDYIGLYRKNGMIICKNSENEEVLDINNGNVFSKNDAIEYIKNEIIKKLNDGIVPTDMFESYYEDAKKNIIFRLFSKYGLIDGNKTLKFGKVFDGIEQIWGGEYYRIIDDGVFYLLDIKGNDVLGKGFKYLSSTVLYDDFIAAKDEEGANVLSIKKHGKKLCAKSFTDSCSFFGTDPNDAHLFLGVDYKEGANLFYADGKKLCKTMDFDDIHFQRNKVVIIVEKEGQVNIMDYNGNILSETWFDRINNPYTLDTKNNPYLKIELNDKYSLFSVKTNSIVTEWFDEVYEPKYGDDIMIVKNDDKFAIYKVGEGLISTWFIKIEKCFRDNIFIVTIDKNRKNIYDIENRNYLFNNWYKDIDETDLDLYLTDDNDNVIKYDYPLWVYGEKYLKEYGRGE